MVGTADYDFSEETAIVTGSTKGIGRGIAAGFAAAGANVVVNARTRDSVEQVAAELDTNTPGTVMGFPGDVANTTDIETMIDSAVEQFGSVDVLVNNAAMWPREESLINATLEEWEQTIAVNVRSQFYASKLVAAHMIEYDVKGSIVNVTSQTGDRRCGGRGLYGISNTAINGLTWRMAHDYARHGIRVNAVSTDVTETYQLRYEAEQIAAERTDTTAIEILEEWGAKRPLGRLGQPSDLADAVLFLCSDRASYVVGDILRVSGGGNLQGDQ